MNARGELRPRVDRRPFTCYTLNVLDTDTEKTQRESVFAILITPSRKHFSIPAYKRVEEDLRARVRNGQWAAGAVLPSRKALAAQYGVNLVTVQRGIGALIADGTLRADNRRGTYVAQSLSAPPPAAPPRREEVSPQDALPRAGKPAPTPGSLALVGIVSDLRLAYPGRAMSAAYDAITEAVESAVCAAGGRTRLLALCQPGKAPLSITEAVQVLLGEGVTALAVLCDPVDGGTYHLADSATVPLVFVTLSELRYPAAGVYYDNRDAGQVACRHLMQNGYGDILFFSPGTALWVEQRLIGAREAMLLSGRPAEAVRAAVGGKGENTWYQPQAFRRFALQCVTEVRARGLEGIGLIAANDEAAVCFLQAAAEEGLVAGRDFGLVAFDDSVEARLVGLTSLRPPLRSMGEEAVRILRDTRPGEALKRVCLHSELITRVSTSPGMQVNADYLPTATEYESSGQNSGRSPAP